MADLVHVALGPERHGLHLALGPLVHEAALLAIERATVEVRLDEVLLDLGSERLHQVAAVADHGVVAQERVLALDHVVHAERHQRCHHRQAPPRPRPPPPEHRDGHEQARAGAEEDTAGHVLRFDRPGQRLRRSAHSVDAITLGALFGAYNLNDEYLGTSGRIRECCAGGAG